MTPEEVYSNVTQGNAEALSFIHLWNTYLHEVDDIVDGERVDRESIIRTFLRSAEVYNSAFYKKHSDALYPLVITITNAYMDSVKWETSSDICHKAYSDILRAAGNEVILMVALLCGGWEHLRLVSADVREISWKQHHDSMTGKGI